MFDDENSFFGVEINEMRHENALAEGFFFFDLLLFFFSIKYI
jgi:hypothetical protein